MSQKLRPLLAAIALIVAVSSVAVFLPSDASAGGGVKFFVVEWRLEWEADNKTVAEDGTVTHVLALKLKGRASLDGVDFDKDFSMEVRDAGPYLEILRTCGQGRMAGVVDDYDTEKGDVIGRRLESLNCRAILK